MDSNILNASKIDITGNICEFYHNDFKPILIKYLDLYSVEYHKKFMICRIAITPTNNTLKFILNEC